MKFTGLAGLSRVGWASGIAIVVCCFAGCPKGDVCSVSGHVTYLGTPVEDGHIRYTPTGETLGPGAAGVIVNGDYSIAAEEGLLAGAYSVAIMGSRVMTTEERDAAKADEAEELADDPPDEDDEEEPDAPRTDDSYRMPIIPQKYNMTTTLTADLVAGDNPDKDYTLE